MNVSGASRIAVASGERALGELALNFFFEAESAWLACARARRPP